MSRMKKQASHRQSGMTLIEVLVAILIFSFGLLGFVGLQARAIQYSMSAEDSNRAALFANEIGAAMVTNGSVTLSSSTYTTWQDRVNGANDPTVGLPNGIGTVSTVGNVATIRVTWRSTNVSASAANSTNQYVTQVIIPQ
jgi:type IV pilus assembly protein PilV